MKRILCIMLLVLLCAGTALAEMPAGLSEQAQQAYAGLRDIDVFAFEPIGYAGDEPYGPYAMAGLFAQDNALEIFEALEADATPAGKLHALCALYYLDNEGYAKRLEKYAEDASPVRQMSGCIMWETPMKDVVFSGDSRAVRLKDQYDTIEAWEQRTGISDWVSDFAGGTYPKFMMEKVRQVMMSGQEYDADTEEPDEAEPDDDAPDTRLTETAAPTQNPNAPVT